MGKVKEILHMKEIEIQTCSAPQNDDLNFSFVKDIYVVGKKWPESLNFGDQSLIDSLCTK